MQSRADYKTLSAASLDALYALGKSLAATALDRAILELVKIRASQMNGCLFCLDMHVKEAKIHGERELRIHHLPLWRESTLFSPKEKAALQWTELLTRPAPLGVEDEDYANVSAHFSEKDVSDLTFAITLINSWNRLGIAFRSTPGTLDKIMGLDKAGLH